jgi:hypothetical protein
MLNVIYADRLIQVTETSILFKSYYFPSGSKRIELSDIDHVEVIEPTLLSGKWRIHGSGDFRTWFPRDLKRPKRDRLFIIHLRNRWRRIGFTVEDSNRLIDVLKDRKILIKDRQSDNSLDNGCA